LDASVSSRSRCCRRRRTSAVELSQLSGPKYIGAPTDVGVQQLSSELSVAEESLAKAEADSLRKQISLVLC